MAYIAFSILDYSILSFDTFHNQSLQTNFTRPLRRKRRPIWRSTVAASCAIDRFTTGIHLVERELGKVAADDGTIVEEMDGIASADRLKEVAKRTLHRGRAEPVGEGAVHASTQPLVPHHACAKHAPVRLGVGVSRVEGDAEAVEHLAIPSLLPLIHPLGEEVESEEPVGVEIVECAPRAGPAVRQLCKWDPVLVGEVEPGLDKGLTLGLQLVRGDGMVGDVGNDGHATDAHDGLDCQIRLICQLSRKVVCRELQFRDEAILDQILESLAMLLTWNVDIHCVHCRAIL